MKAAVLNGSYVGRETALGSCSQGWVESLYENELCYADVYFADHG
jgi:hypothetical protein